MKVGFNRLFDQVDNSQLIFFRIVFGALMFLESWGAIATGWVKQVFIDTRFTFTFIGFEWLGFLHGEIMYAFYILMGLAGLSVMIGFRYRLSAVILLIMWTATYLVQKTNYNNHYYLAVLLCAFMVVVPANRYFSLDASRDPRIESLTCPRWSVLIFQVQVSIVYLFAFIAKLYPDWLQADPVKIWLRMKSHYILIGGILQMEFMPYFISYGGILFDALIIPALLWRRTRILAFGISIFFHLFNSIVFQVGIFPYLMLAITAFFFPVTQVRQLLFRKKPEAIDKTFTKNNLSHLVWILVLSFYFILQIFLPLRHHLFKGNVHWTEEGHRMAWRMMLRVKSAGINFKVIDNVGGDTLNISPGNYLTLKQRSTMASRPDMAWQFVQYLKKELENDGIQDYSIYAASWARLNNRKSGPLISGDVDLAKVKWEPFRHSSWLMPLPER